MNEVKSPKKPLIYYYLAAILLVVLFNMAVTLVGILLAVYLNICQKRERAAQVQ